MDDTDERISRIVAQAAREPVLTDEIIALFRDALIRHSIASGWGEEDNECLPFVRVAIEPIPEGGWGFRLDPMLQASLHVNAYVAYQDLMAALKAKPASSGPLMDISRSYISRYREVGIDKGNERVAGFFSLVLDAMPRHA